MGWDKIFEIVLVLINFIFDKVADRERAIKNFREVFAKIEKRNESSQLSKDAEDQFDELSKF